MRINKYELSVLVLIFLITAFVMPVYVEQLAITFSERFFAQYQLQNMFGEFFFWTVIYALPAALVLFPVFDRRDFVPALVYVAFIGFSWWEWFVNPISRTWLAEMLGYAGANAAPAIAYQFQLFGNTYFAYLHAFIAEVPTWLSLLLIFFSRDIARFSKKHLPNYYQMFPSPKHLAIIVIATAWLAVWPTVFTLVLYPFVVYLYRKQGREQMLKRR